MPSFVFDIAGTTVEGKDEDNQQAGWAVLIRARSMVAEVQRGLCGVCEHDEQTSINATLHAAHFSASIAHHVASHTSPLVIIQRSHCPYIAQRDQWTGMHAHKVICDSIAYSRNCSTKVGAIWTDITVLQDEDTYHAQVVTMANECANRIYHHRAYCRTCNIDLQATANAVVEHYFNYHEGNVQSI